MRKLIYMYAIGKKDNSLFIFVNHFILKFTAKQKRKHVALHMYGIFLVASDDGYVKDTPDFACH